MWGHSLSQITQSMVAGRKNHGLSGARVGKDPCVHPQTPDLQVCSLPFAPLLTKEAERLQFKHIWNEKLPVKSHSRSLPLTENRIV